MRDPHANSMGRAAAHCQWPRRARQSALDVGRRARVDRARWARGVRLAKFLPLQNRAWQNRADLELRGRASERAGEWFDDAARLEDVVRELSALHEHDRPAPWRIEDAPRAYVDAMLRGIVGVEVRVERIEAKRKLSQNKSAADFNGVIAGLEAAPDTGSRDFAAMMRAVRAAADDPDGN